MINLRTLTDEELLSHVTAISLATTDLERELASRLADALDELADYDVREAEQDAREFELDQRDADLEERENAIK